jgi:hypothetical protein
MSNGFLAGKREPLERVRARLEALIRANAAPRCGLDPSGPASPAERQPWRTAGARFTAARARDHARPRAWSAAGEQTGNTGTFRGKPRRNGRACVPQYLRSAICATQFKTLSRAQEVHRSFLTIPPPVLPIAPPNSATASLAWQQFVNPTGARQIDLAPCVGRVLSRAGGMRERLRK